VRSLHVTALACLLAGDTAAWAGQGKLEVADSDAKELKRTAHRLRIPVDQLRKARLVLEEATELAGRADPDPQLGASLARTWLMFERRAAPAKIELLLAAPRLRAQEADALPAYRAAISAAQAVLVILAEVDESRAFELASAWPTPPAGSGPEGDEVRRTLERGLRRDVARQLSYRDPERATGMLDRGAAEASGSPTTLARLAAQRLRQGRKDEALELADRALAGVRTGSWTLADSTQYGGFVAALAEVDYDRALAGVEALMRAEVPPAPTPAGFDRNRSAALRLGTTTLPLSPNELLFVDVLRAIGSRPELTARALALAPDLRSKLEQLGGVDAFLVFDNESGMQGVVFGPETTAGPDLQEQERLVARLRTRTTRDTDLTERVLDEKTTDFDTLAMLAQRMSLSDPALASRALGRARELVRTVEPLDKRAGQWLHLMRIWRVVDGEVPAALFREGLRLAEELQGEGRESARSKPAEVFRGLTSADAIEVGLLGEYARADFEEALRLARRLPEGRRLAGLVQIAQSFGRF
jgi:hypothetical protein